MTNVFEGKSIQKTVLKLGLPAMLAQLATLIYNIADTYFVSLTNSPAQIAAVTLCSPVLLIIMSISSIFGMGGSSVIARMLGAKNTKDAKNCVSFCFYAMAVSGIIMLGAGLLFIKPIASLAGADAENFAYTCDYLKWIFLGAPFIILTNGQVHIFRSTGLIRQATTAVILGNCINILFDWIFIVRLNMGTAGAAAATSIGFLCSTIYELFVMLRRSADHSLFSLSPKELHVKKTLVTEVVKIGIPGALVTIMLSVSNIILNNYIGIYGSDAVASYGIANKIYMFPAMLSVGLSQGVMPLIGYCYGAQDKERMHKAMRTGALDGILLGAIFTALFLLFSTSLTSIFLHEPKLIEQSAFFLRILCLASPVLGITNMVISYYQALGKAFQSLLITMLRNVVIFIPCVIIMNALFKLTGTILSQCIVEVLMAAICVVMYLGSRKKV